MSDEVKSIIAGVAGTVIAFMLLAAIVALYVTPAPAADWGGPSNNAAVAAWFAQAPVQSCCGEGDAYEADYFEAVKSDTGGVYYIVSVTPTEETCRAWRDNGWQTLGPGEPKDDAHCKQAIPPNTKVTLPESMIKYVPPNPTGHGVIFLRQNGDLSPICYYLPSLT